MQRLWLIVLGVFLTGAPAFAAAGGIPALTPTQTTMLRDGTVDGPQFDQPGLYALMQNAAWWPARPEIGPAVPATGAATSAPSGPEKIEPVPIFSALESDPAAHRGELFTIEGAFAGFDARTPLKIAHFLQPGPWENRAQRWGLVTDLSTQHTVLVVLVDPPDRPPQRRVPVRVVGRFYMLWKTPNRNGNPAQFLVFVGAQPQSPGTATEQGDAGVPGRPTTNFWSSFFNSIPSPVALGLTAILVLFIPFLLLRIWLGRRARGVSGGGGRTLQEEFAKARLDAAATDQTTTQAPLPEDPAAALREMERRKGGNG